MMKSLSVKIDFYIIYTNKIMDNNTSLDVTPDKYLSMLGKVVVGVCLFYGVLWYGYKVWITADT